MTLEAFLPRRLDGGVMTRGACIVVLLAWLGGGGASSS